jgi:hypothetical protein
LQLLVLFLELAILSFPKKNQWPFLCTKHTQFTLKTLFKKAQNAKKNERF